MYANPGLVLEELVRCGKTRGTTYEACQSCFLPYDDVVRTRTKSKCVGCNRVRSCDRTWCKPVLDADWMLCVCSRLVCCNCPNECCVCHRGVCVACMTYCQSCNEYCCSSCYVDDFEVCIECKIK